ncbi:hypothetical protein V6N13_100935 [Hibiscus sabdariffa]
MVGVVDYVVDERCAGMESTLCMIRVIEREDAVHKAVNEGLVTEGDVTNAVVKKNSNALGPCYIDIDFGLNSLNRDYVVAIDVEQVDNAMVPYIESNFVFLGACVVRKLTRHCTWDAWFEYTSGREEDIIQDILRIIEESGTIL